MSLNELHYNTINQCPFKTRLAAQREGRLRVLFSSKYFECDTILFKAADKINGQVIPTPLGRLVCYSWTPNIKMVETKDGFYAVSISPIYPGKELALGYN